MGGFFVDSLSSFIITRWVFLRLLGIIYLIAFVSFGVQTAGLIGKNGILPAGEYLQAVKKAYGRKAFLQVPTLALLNSSDAFLRFLWIAGAALALLLILGLQTTPILLLLYLLYLSLLYIGQAFLSFQWDALLLETGFLSIFLVAPSLLPGQALAPPSPVVIFLFRWLLFRLMFMSGAAKLASHDPTWKSLTALMYHYETQPLPLPTAYFAHRLPLWFQKFSTLVSLLIEIPVPFLVFFPGVLRLIGGGLMVFLQLLILGTGNYAFFNYLSITLATFLLNDSILQRLLPPALLLLVPPAPTGSWVAWSNWVIVPLAVILVAAGLSFMIYRFLRNPAILGLTRPLMVFADTLHIVNPYGLFASMTTRRPEIILEGSNDGENWQPYEFKYKPGPLDRPLPVVAPHQPRLDWQIWFAALSDYRKNPWFLHFIQRLLEGSPEVLRLLAKNPFPEKPPHYIRALLYDYRFTTPSEKRQTGNWWRRDALGYYMPTASMEADQ